jgi:hypothetical protein
MKLPGRKNMVTMAKVFIDRESRCWDSANIRVA